MADMDAFAVERVRLALLPDTDWHLHEIASTELPHIAALRAKSGRARVLFVPISALLSLTPNPFPMPIIGFGAPSLFDAVPAGFCDDLIGDHWNPAELRFRVTRLVGAHSGLSWHGITCSPHLLFSDVASVGLSVAQYQIMTLLLRADGASVPRETLQAALAPPSSAFKGHGAQPRGLDMHISRLRKKLLLVSGEHAPRPRIIAHRGHGYSLGV